MPPLRLKPVVVVAALLACAFAPLSSGSPASRAKKAAGAKKAAEATKMESMTAMLQTMAINMADKKMGASSDQKAPETGVVGAQLPGEHAGLAMPGEMPKALGLPDAQAGGLAMYPGQPSPEEVAWKAVAAQREAGNQLSGMQAGLMSASADATKLNTWNPSQGLNQANDQLNVAANQPNKMSAPTDAVTAKPEAVEDAHVEEKDPKDSNGEKESKTSNKVSSGKHSKVPGVASRLSGSARQKYLWMGAILIVIFVCMLGIAMAVSARIFNTKYERTVACSESKMARLKLKAQAYQIKHGQTPTGSLDKV
mmetsp:Transcript_50539/g.94150  ORF Transcript_50539/g.94150 Transcript_50539/m.94150 type:complete len:310 (+) Transcript_50539:188-1117(+)